MADAHALATPLHRRLGLLRSYAVSTGTLLVASAAQLVTFAVLARGLGLEQFGLLLTVTAVTNVAVQLCGLGAQETLVRRVAPEPALYPAVLGHGLILVAGSGLALTIALTAILPRFVSLDPDPVANLSALGALVLANVVLSRVVLLAEQAFIARWRMGMANAVNAGFALGRTATAAFACGAFGVHRVVDWAYWTLGAHALMALACAAAVAGLGRPRFVLLRREVALGAYFSTAFVFRTLRQNVDLVILNAVAGPATVAAYGMARRVVDTASLTTEALHRLTYPRLAAMAGSGYRAMRPMIGQLTAAAGALGLATALGLWVVAPAMPRLFGRDFGDMIGDLRVMCWVMVLFALHDAAAEVLGASARHGLRAALYNVGNLAGAALSAALTYALLLPGTFLALYLTEGLLVVAFWISLLVLIQRDRVRPAGPASNGDRT